MSSPDRRLTTASERDSSRSIDSTSSHASVAECQGLTTRMPSVSATTRTRHAWTRAASHTTAATAAATREWLSHAITAAPAADAGTIHRRLGLR